MAYENNGELVLSAEETAALLHNMLHPNVEASMRRDEFLRDLSDLHIDLTNGEITANCPDIQLPSELPREGHSLYDDSKLNRLELESVHTDVSTIMANKMKPAKTMSSLS